MNLAYLIAPELILVAVACTLFLLGTVNRAGARHLSAVLALAATVFMFSYHAYWAIEPASSAGHTDEWQTVNVGGFATYVKMLVSGVGAVLVLLAWPTNRDATGSPSIHFGHDVGEFFGLMLLSITGVFLVASSNDIILLFLGIELASIPTYIMVSVSRPLPAAQEAGVKYFFLGAMAAAVMLFGFSYLYGTTGVTKLNGPTGSIAAAFDAARPKLTVHVVEKADEPAAEAGAQHPPAVHGSASPAVASVAPTTAPATAPIGQTLNDPRRAWGAGPMGAWQLLGIVLLLAGLGFKIAAVPLHTYVGDVYQGAATPVTAFLAFIPKTSGLVGIIKILFAVGGEHWVFPPILVNLVIIVAGLTMTVGNVLGLLQLNVKRLLAYSSIAHSGYMLVGVAALMHAAHTLGNPGAASPEAISRATGIQDSALQGVLFYLAAYGVMNAGAFGVLMLLPSRAVSHGKSANGRAALHAPPATTAETFEDLAGEGKRHPLLGLAMAVCCFSLIGLPLTVGLVGKLFLIKPALASGLFWLVVVTVVNSAISAAYYLRIVATMFLREVPDDTPAAESAMADDEEAGESAATPADRSPDHSTVGGSVFGLQHSRPFPVRLAVGLSVALTILLGTWIPATDALAQRLTAARLDANPAGPATVVAPPVHASGVPAGEAATPPVSLVQP